MPIGIGDGRTLAYSTQEIAKLIIGSDSTPEYRNMCGTIAEYFNKSENNSKVILKAASGPDRVRIGHALVCCMELGLPVTKSLMDEVSHARHILMVEELPEIERYHRKIEMEEFRNDISASAVKLAPKARKARVVYGTALSRYYADFYEEFSGTPTETPSGMIEHFLGFVKGGGTDFVDRVCVDSRWLPVFKMPGGDPKTVNLKMAESALTRLRRNDKKLEESIDKPLAVPL